MLKKSSDSSSTSLSFNIPVFRPSYGEEELEGVKECLEKGWTGNGPKVKAFEEQFANYIGTRYAVSTNSCTASLHLSLQALEIKGREVISTPMTFVSTNHAILYNGGIPVFADIEPDTLNISVESIKRKITPRTKGIIVVHFGGHACDMDAILKLAEEHGLFVLEDVAHGCGGEYRGKKLGSMGALGCFSFHAVKNLAIGDGGMITTNNASFYERLLKTRWLGISKDTWARAEKGSYSWDYFVGEVGFKYHMNDIGAAIGLAQLKRLDERNQRRAEIARIYDNKLKDMPGMKVPPVCPYVTRHARHNYVLRVERRNNLVEFLKQQGIATGVHYRPNNHYPMYEDQKDATPVAEEVWQKIVTLPLFPSMTQEEIDHVIASLYSFYSGTV